MRCQLKHHQTFGQEITCGKCGAPLLCDLSEHICERCEVSWTMQPPKSRQRTSFSDYTYFSDLTLKGKIKMVLMLAFMIGVGIIVFKLIWVIGEGIFCTKPDFEI